MSSSDRFQQPFSAFKLVEIGSLIRAVNFYQLAILLQINSVFLDRLQQRWGKIGHAKERPTSVVELYIEFVQFELLTPSVAISHRQGTLIFVVHQHIIQIHPLGFTVLIG